LIGATASCGGGNAATRFHRAHSRAGALSATISGYLGSNDEFDKAMGKFALAYADQAERDYAALKAAVRKGKIAVCQE